MEESIVLPEIMLLIILILLNAYFAASEIALITLNDNKIRMMAEGGDRKAKKLMNLLKEPSRFLATIQIGITLAGFMASAFAAESFVDPLVSWLNDFELPISDGALKGIMLVAITVVLSYFTLVFGELVPKRVAMKKAEAIAFRVVGPLMLISKATAPFVHLLTLSTNFFAKFFGVNPGEQDDNVTEEEIRMMIDLGEERGTIHCYEKEMINNVFEFNNTVLEEIMTHRVNIKALPLDAKLDEAIDLILNVKYSKIPVYKKNLDNIIGILHTWDLLHLVGKKFDGTFNLEQYVRTPIYLPVMKKTDEALRSMQIAKAQIAVVVDEYGGTAGIVTLEDLIEEVVGDIEDEKSMTEDIHQLNDYTYDVSGKVTLEELHDYLGIELPEGEYETLNGFAISRLGIIPDTIGVVEITEGNVTLRPTRISDKRIDRFLLILAQESERK
jgi:putative hemolysin